MRRGVSNTLDKQSCAGSRTRDRTPEQLFSSQWYKKRMEVDKHHGRIYDARSQTDVRDYPHYCTHDSIWRLFSVDFAHEQNERLYGESAASEFLSCRTRSCGRYRHSFTGLPDIGGLGGSPLAACLACAYRSAPFGDSDIGRLLFLDAATCGCRALRSSQTNLCGRCYPCDLSNHTRRGLDQNFTLHVEMRDTFGKFVRQDSPV